MTDDRSHRALPPERGLDGPPSMPRWAKSLLLILVVIAVLAMLVTLLSDSDHGPGRHGALGLDARAGSTALRVTHP